ncbi:MAG: monooxygenase [Rhizobiales bacterium 62-17]|nr:LLM class flavin-dependent oxidoreductase [Hyphomicrobiales bacterium]OJY00284.1 MAG: monooxygenase [Rhizobiales bacterium 62-17]
MEYGVQFFPDVKPEEKSAARYFEECLNIAEQAESLGFTHGRMVEHYFHYYGGYSPNPLLFLASLAQRTRKMRLITGALLPVFSNPLKMAGEIAMADALSNGRVDIGFARAFLPHEFRRFGISPNESVRRFREGIRQIDLLLREDVVNDKGEFLTIENTTSLPRPTQTPRPKFYVAALNTPESFEYAGQNGFSIMAIPIAGGRMRELTKIYRDAWRAAGHPGDGEVMLAFHMYCEPDGDQARATAKPFIEGYFHSLVDAASDWLSGTSSDDYPGYANIMNKLKATNMENQIEGKSAWIGSPQELRETVAGLFDEFGPFEHASLQIGFNMLPYDKAIASMNLFAKEVMPFRPKRG